MVLVNESRSSPRSDPLFHDVTSHVYVATGCLWMGRKQHRTPGVEGAGAVYVLRNAP